MDTITRAILVNQLEMITEEMAEYLVRASFSTNIKNRRDASCAIYDAEGELIAQGQFIPVHLGVMAETIKELLKVYPIDTLKDGDIFVHNDTYMMGSHLFDVSVFKPMFWEGKLYAFCGAIAHHVDIGGSPVGLSEGTIFQEGLRITGLKLYREGELQEDIIRLLTSNVRAPYEFRGDLMAQVAAMRRGETRLQELVEKFGLNELMEYFAAIKDYAENSMRSVLRGLPDGEAEFEDYIESPGKPATIVPVHVKIAKKESEVWVDFNGTGAPVSANVNAPLSITKAGVYYSIRAIAGEGVCLNAGAYRVIHFVPIEKTTIVNSKAPYAAGACTTIPCQRVIDTVFGAFSKLCPERVSACDGQWAGVGFSGTRSDTGELFSYTETYGAGRGAKHDSDGASAHQTHASNTANAPTELIELEHPFIVEQYRLAPGSSGAGKFRGGLSIERTMRCLEDTHVTALVSRGKTVSYGLFGGKPGGHDGAYARFPDGTERAIQGEKVPAGTVLTFRTAGGGGWGDPRERDRDLVQNDLNNGYISMEEAVSIYGLTQA